MEITERVREAMSMGHHPAHGDAGPKAAPPGAAPTLGIDQELFRLRLGQGAQMTKGARMLAARFGTSPSLRSVDWA
jgi:hypothetical protein